MHHAESFVHGVIDQASSVGWPGLVLLTDVSKMLLTAVLPFGQLKIRCWFCNFVL